MSSLLLLLTTERAASGAAPASIGHLTVSPAAVTFAATQTGTAAPDQMLILSNTGTAALALFGVTIAGTNAADFSRGALPASIAAGASATLTIHCTPAATGARSATLSIAHNGDNTPTAVPLAATGVAPAYLTIVPASLAFPATRLPATSTLTLTLSNTGGEPLTYSTAFSGLAASDYTISTAGSGTIAAGGAAALTVVFTPAQAGSRPATLTITDNASDGPTTAIPVSGVGQLPVGAFQPYARLIDIRSGAVVATTTHLAGFSRTIGLDAPLTGTLSVPASDPGAATATTGTSFGQAALQAAGTDDGTAPVPTTVEAGVSGPGGVIAVRLRVTAVTRSYKDGAPVIDITGEGPLAGYAGVVVAHAYYPGCRLADVLSSQGATQTGYIVPVASGTAGFLSPSGAIPYLGGLFSRPPGLPAWAGKALLAVTPAVDSSIAGISTNLETRGDTTLRALEAATKRMAGDYIAGDAYPIGYRGHSYEDAASLSSAGNGVVVGTIGGSPASGFTLDGNGSGAVDETVMARIVESSIETNSADTYGQVLFTGGKSNAGLPDGATITGLGLLNPIGSGDRTDYTTCLPIISYQTGDKTGGVAFFNNDGLLRPLLTGAGPVYSLYVDTAPTGSTIYIGTADGVLSRSADVRAAHNWTPVGTLHARITRLSVQRDNAGTVHLFAQAAPKDANLHGIYSYVAASPGLTGAGYDAWTPAVVGAHVQSFVMTDYQTAWVLLDNDQGRIHQIGLGGASSAPMTPYALPAGVRAFALDRVITAGDGSHPPQDSVWAMTKGDAQSTYMLVRNGTTWGPFAPADADGSLAGAAGGAEPTINGAVGLGVTVGGQYTSVFVSTSQGLYWSATLAGTGWKSACGLNGLAGVSIAGVAAGQYQALQGVLDTRFFAYNPKQFFYSSSDARYWRDLTKEEVSLGVWFADLARRASGDLPSNAVITIGPMASSPIGNPANTHIQAAGANQDLPADWYWQRTLDDCLDWQVRLVNPDASTDAALASGLSDLQTNTAVTPLRASGDVARVARRWLSENSVPARTLKVRCPLTRQESALWAVRPGMLLPVNLQDTINQLSADGSSIVGTQVVHMVNALWWVIEATITLDESGGSLAYADLTLSTVLRKDKTSPADIAAGLQDQIKSLNSFGAKG